MSTFTFASRTLLGSVVLPGLLASAAFAGEKLVVEAGRVVLSPGQEIQGGVIVVEDGRIVAVGKRGEVEVPWDAPVVGGPDHVAIPGFIEAYSSRGMDRPNEGVDVAPFLNVRDSVDPINVTFEDYLRWGVTTINTQQGGDCVVGAQGRVLKPIGVTVEEMTVRPNYGLVMSSSPKRGKSRATQAQALRGAFGDLELYLEGIVADAKDGGDRARREALYQGRDMEGDKAEGRPMGGSAWQVEGLALIPRGAIDEKWEPLLDLVEGRTKAFVHASAARDVLLGLEVAKDNGFLENTVLIVNGDAHKAAGHIAAAGVPVVIAGNLTYSENDPVTGEEIETDVIAAYEAAGVTYALSSADASTNSLWFRAERAIAQGTDPVKAFAAVMQTPADMLGIGDQVGSLEVGKLGNVVLLTGDPMDPGTWVDEVVIEGERVYRRSEDIRNKYVFEGEEPTGIDAMPRTGEQ